jgi:hypothetical protein
MTYVKGSRVSLKKRIEAVELKQAIDMAILHLEYTVLNLNRLIQKDYWGVADRNLLARYERELSLRIIRTNKESK